MSDLAKRAVACKHWKWTLGMRAHSPFYEVFYRVVALRQDWCLVLDGTGDGAPVCQYRDIDDAARRPNGVCNATPLYDLNDDLIPDLTDPATLGCLLALVREAWGDPSLCANDAGHYDLMFWHVYTDDRNVSVGCQTEAEALVAALEAAP